MATLLAKTHTPVTPVIRDPDEKPVPPTLLPRCISRSGVHRDRHSFDRDDVCVYCDTPRDQIGKLADIMMHRLRDSIETRVVNRNERKAFWRNRED